MPHHVQVQGLVWLEDGQHAVHHNVGQLVGQPLAQLGAQRCARHAPQRLPAQAAAAAAASQQLAEIVGHAGPLPAAASAWPMRPATAHLPWRRRRDRRRSRRGLQAGFDPHTQAQVACWQPASPAPTCLPGLPPP